MFELLGFFTSCVCFWKITKLSLPVCWVKACGFYWLSSPVSLSFLNEKDKGECLTLNNCKATDGFWGSDFFYLSPIKAQSSQDLPNETVTHLARSSLSAPSFLVTPALPLGLRLDAFSSVNSCLTHLCFLSASLHPNWVPVVLYPGPLSLRPDHKLQGTRRFYFYILRTWYIGLKKHAHCHWMSSPQWSLQKQALHVCPSMLGRIMVWWNMWCPIFQNLWLCYAWQEGLHRYDSIKTHEVGRSACIIWVGSMLSRGSVREGKWRWPLRSAGCRANAPKNADGL